MDESTKPAGQQEPTPPKQQERSRSRKAPYQDTQEPKAGSGAMEQGLLPRPCRPAPRGRRGTLELAHFSLLRHPRRPLFLLPPSCPLGALGSTHQHSGMEKSGMGEEKTTRRLSVLGEK